MLHAKQDQTVYCHFQPPVLPSKFYTCYKRETCCDQGCCTNDPGRLGNMWYYWLVFLAIFGVISGANWLCKKEPSVRSRSHRAPSTIRCNRRRCCRNFEHNTVTGCTITENGISFNNCNRNQEHNTILDRLLFSFGSSTPVGDPPSYSSIVPSESGFCPLFSHYGPPPAYSTSYQSSSRQQATELPKYEASFDDARVQIINNNEDPSTSTTTTGEISFSTDTGTDEEAKPSKEDDKEKAKTVQ